MHRPLTRHPAGEKMRSVVSVEVAAGGRKSEPTQEAVECIAASACSACASEAEEDIVDSSIEVYMKILGGERG